MILPCFIGEHFIVNLGQMLSKMSVKLLRYRYFRPSPNLPAFYFGDRCSPYRHGSGELAFMSIDLRHNSRILGRSVRGACARSTLSLKYVRIDLDRVPSKSRLLIQDPRRVFLLPVDILRSVLALLCSLLALGLVIVIRQLPSVFRC